MADTKRKEPDSYGAAPARGNGTALVKRARQDADADGQQVAISSGANGKDKGLVRSVRRTSSLAAPILALTGAHGAEVLDVAFSPDGAYIAACSIDRSISLWTTYGENSNLGLLTGHSKAVTALCWSRQAPSHTPRLFTASADSTLIVWDALNGQKLRRLRGHHGIVNTVAVSRGAVRGASELLASGSDDGNVMLWDWENSSKPRDSFRVGYPVTAVEFSEDGSQVYVGGLDNEIHVYEIATKEIVFSLRGHTDTVLCTRLSSSGTQLLSTGADGTVRIWDVRPFAPEPAPGHVGSPRLIRTLEGLPIGFEQVLIRGAWAPDGRRVIAGGGDGTMSLWNTETGELVYKLPGHKGSVPSVAYHPKEPIVVSCSFDMGLILGEVEP